jgi:acyl dehydratase
LTVNVDIAGKPLPAVDRSWDEKDALLYALGVGCAQEDPLAELELTTENSHCVDQAVLPTFAVLLMGRLPLADFGDFALSQIVHAEQGLRLHAPLPPAGQAVVRPRVAGIYDKGSGALIEVTADVNLRGERRAIATLSSSIFIVGEGNFGGDRGVSSPWESPTGPPDFTVVMATRPEQALIYRLSGDRNPLHSDPWAARRSGFDRPILHGLCTYAYTARALIRTVCTRQSRRFGAMRCRFTRPVFPGDELTVSIWRDDAGARFSTCSAAGIVIDRGVFELAPGEPAG